MNWNPRMKKMCGKKTRLIDANALKYDLGEIDDGLCKRTELYVTNEAIAQQPTIEAEPHWIPCSERLPETTDEVLTTYIVNGNKKRRFVQTSTWYGNEEEGYWSSPWDEYLVPNTKIEVLAWMPLPKPYEGDKE